MGIKFTCSSELMDNYKIMDLASSENKMLALCDESKNRLFSIGDDKALYLTYESDGNETGWEKINLSQDIKEYFKGKAIEIKNFEAIRDLNANKYIIALIVTVDKKDNLFISMEQKAESPFWNTVPFDNPGNKGDNISNIYISAFNKNISIICDVCEDNGLIKRYFIDDKNILNSKIKWVKHTLPSDFEITNNSCMGKSFKEHVDGIYTLGTTSKKQQLIYTPVYNAFDPSIIANPMRFNLPKNVDVITCATIYDNSKKPYTHLFACGSGSLYLFPYGSQHDGVSPIEIAVSDKFKEVNKLYAYEINNTIMVWGINQNRKVFYCFCNKDDIANNKWSEVLTFMDNVEYIYPFINETSNSNSILGYGTNKTVILGEQSPITTLWTYNNITLPQSDGKALKFTSYTTKITVSDDDGNLVKKQKVYLKAMDYCNVYINGLYYAMKENPIEVNTNEYGVIKIIYKTYSPISKNFEIWAVDSEKSVINPWEKTIDKLLALQTPEDLKKATIVDSKGNRELLVPKDTSDDGLKAVVDAMSTLSKTKESLLDNNKNIKLSKKASQFQGVTICVENNRIESYTGMEALLKAKDLNLVTMNPSGALTLNSNSITEFDFSQVGGILDDIRYTFGDILRYIKDFGTKIYKICISYIEDGWNFIVSIGEKIYSFVIDCADKLVSCIEVAFNFIKVTIEKIIDFLKFAFDWNDILKTKDVSKKIFNLGVDKLDQSVLKVKDTVHDKIEKITKEIDVWAGISHIDEFGDKTINQISNENRAADTSSVTDSFLIDHFTDNCKDMQMKFNIQINNAMTVEAKANALGINSEKDYKKIFEELSKTQGKIMDNLIAQIKTEFIDNKIQELDFISVIKKLTAIATDAVLYSLENGINTFIDLFSVLIEIVKEALNYEIKIPVLSDILEDLYGIKPFSLLDIMCIITSVLTNATYKLLTQERLFDDATYKFIMESNSIDELFGENKRVILNANESIGTEGYDESELVELWRIKKITGLPETANKKVICITCHTVGGVLRILESALHGIVVLENQEPMISGLDLGFIFVGTVLSWVASVAYKPYTLMKGMIAIPIITKYIPLVCRFANKVKLFTKIDSLKFIGSKEFEICADGAYTIGCFMDLLINGVYIAATSCENKDKDEKKVAIIELTGNTICNIACILDIATKYNKNPYVLAVLETIRVCSILGYAGLQISEGVIISDFEVAK